MEEKYSGEQDKKQNEKKDLIGIIILVVGLVALIYCLHRFGKNPDKKFWMEIAGTKIYANKSAKLTIPLDDQYDSDRYGCAAVRVSLNDFSDVDHLRVICPNGAREVDSTEKGILALGEGKRIVESYNNKNKLISRNKLELKFMRTIQKYPDYKD